MRGSEREPQRPIRRGGTLAQLPRSSLCCGPSPGQFIDCVETDGGCSSCFLHHYGHTVTVTNRNHLRKERPILQRGGAIRGQRGGLAQFIAVGARAETCSHHNRTRTGKQVGETSISPKASPSNPLPPAKPHLLKVPKSSQNSTTHERKGLRRWEPLRDISNSSDSRC